MIETKDLFSDGQGALVERLGLLVLALDRVEECQVVEGVRCSGMLRAKGLFTNGQGALVEWLGIPSRFLCKEEKSTNKQKEKTDAPSHRL